MASSSKLLMVMGCVLALSGVQACLSSSSSDGGGELNPQPLPPSDPEKDRSQEDGESTGAVGSSSSGGGSGSSSSGGSPAPAADAGADAPEGG